MIVTVRKKREMRKVRAQNRVKKTTTVMPDAAENILLETVQGWFWG